MESGGRTAAKLCSRVFSWTQLPLFTSPAGEFTQVNTIARALATALKVPAALGAGAEGQASVRVPCFTCGFCFTSVVLSSHARRSPNG